MATCLLFLLFSWFVLLLETYKDSHDMVKSYMLWKKNEQPIYILKHRRSENVFDFIKEYVLIAIMIWNKMILQVTKIRAHIHNIKNNKSYSIFRLGISASSSGSFPDKLLLSRRLQVKRYILSIRYRHDNKVLEIGLNVFLVLIFLLNFVFHIHLSVLKITKQHAVL